MIIVQNWIEELKQKSAPEVSALRPAAAFAKTWTPAKSSGPDRLQISSNPRQVSRATNRVRLGPAPFV